MSMRHFWRRFRPSNFGQPLPVVSVSSTIWQEALSSVNELFPGRQIREDAIVSAIQSARDQAAASDDPVLWATAVILQAPRAASAQEQMDRHPHGYKNKQARLFELIDFNDTYVSTVLATPEDQLTQFRDDAKEAMDVFCKRLKMRCFSNEQYEAITHGLSREIAVYCGAIAEGFAARMTSRVDDALGIDMVITDPASGRSINIDCKTHSAFYYRLKDLMREGRVTVEQAAAAEDNGYAWIVNGNEQRQERIVLLRIDSQTYGEIIDFSFQTTTVFGQMLTRILSE